MEAKLMTGAVEEGAKVAVSISEGLRTQPLSLALVVMNIVFVILVGWLGYTINERTTHQYRVKDDMINELVGKIQGVMTDVKTEVRDNSTRIQANAVVAGQVTQTLERLAHQLDDHERRIRDLEKVK
jgi:hypothetical protein